MDRRAGAIGRNSVLKRVNTALSVPAMRIDRCVCHDMLFSVLADAARRHDCRTIEELRACSSFGEGCGHCHVYVEEMLKTGQTVFTRLLPRTQRTGAADET